jgi:hypothetical protein
LRPHQELALAATDVEQCAWGLDYSVEDGDSLRCDMVEVSGEVWFEDVRWTPTCLASEVPVDVDLARVGVLARKRHVAGIAPAEPGVTSEAKVV